MVKKLLSLLLHEQDYMSSSISTCCHLSTSGWNPPPLTIGLGSGSSSMTIRTRRGFLSVGIWSVTSFS